MHPMANMTLKQIWDAHEDSAEKGISLDLNEKDQGTDAFLPRIETRRFMIEGLMPYPDKQVFYGWYVQQGVAQVWAAYGNETPESIYGKDRWVLGGRNYKSGLYTNSDASKGSTR